MSKFNPQPRINNPEKKIPADKSEQFFIALKSGDLDRINGYVIDEKIRYAITDQYDKESTKKTPVHIILELDSKIANPITKLLLLEYLYNLGSPIDLPDKSDVYPIHLAVQSQNEKLVDFFINRGVNLDRTDTSGNTALHYAIYGKKIDCPIPEKIKPLSTNLTKEKDTSDKLSELNQLITKIINDNYGDDMKHITQTIKNIPSMFEADPFLLKIKTDLVTIFDIIANDPNYKFALAKQEQAIQKVIDDTYSFLNERVLRNFMDPLDIRANNKGWGPTLTNAAGSNGSDSLTKSLEKILPDERFDTYRSHVKKYNEMKENIINKSTDTQIIDRSLYSLGETINNLYLLNYFFGSKFSGNTIFTCKLIYLLAWNSVRTGYATDLTTRIISLLPVMSKKFYEYYYQGKVYVQGLSVIGFNNR